MGNYASIDDITTRLDTRGITFSGSTNPTDAEVSGLIDQVEAEIDSVLVGQGYATVPANGTRDVKMLRRYTADKVAAETVKIIFTAQQLPDWVKSWLDDYAAFLNRLRQGQQRLLDQSPTSTMAGVITTGSATLKTQHWGRGDIETYEQDFGSSC